MVALHRRFLRLRFLVPLGALAMARTVDAQACVRVWSPPDTLRTPSGHMVYVEHPDLLQERRGLTLFGGPTFAFNEAGEGIADSSDGTVRITYAGIRIPTRGGRLLWGDVQMIPLPPGPKEWSTPRVLATGDDAGPAWFMVPDTMGGGTIWTSRWTAGSWSGTRRDESRDASSWRFGEASSLHRAGGRAAFVTRLKDRDVWPGAVNISISGAIRSHPLGLPSAYYPTVSFADDTGSRVLVAYVSLKPTVDSVIVVHVPAPPEPVSRVAVAVLPKGSVQGVQMIRVGREVSVLWLGGGIMDGRHVGLARSRDGGTTWRREPDLQLRASRLRLKVTAGAAGQLHVVVASSDATPPDYYTFHDGTWSAPSAVGTAPSINEPALFTERGTLHVIWGAPMMLRGERMALLLHASASCAS